MAVADGMIAARRLRASSWMRTKDASLRTGLWNNLFFNVYPFMFDPKQLVFLIQCIKSASAVPGRPGAGSLQIGPPRSSADVAS